MFGEFSFVRVIARFPPAACVVLGLSGCLFGSDDDSANQTADATKPVIAISSTRAVARIGESFSLSAKYLPTSANVSSIKWTASDGQQSTSSTFHVQFRAAGTYSISLSAVAADGTALTADTNVVVIDASASVASVFGLPDVPGDISGDAGLDLVDALTLAQTLSGKAKTTLEIAGRADVDLDGATTANDLALVLSAIASETQVPSAALRKELYPGSVLPIISPALLDLSSAAVVRINGLPATAGMRVIPGYMTLVLPQDQAIIGVERQLTIEIAGQVVDMFNVNVGNLPVPPTDASGDINTFLDQYQSAIQSYQAALAKISTASGLTDDQKQQMDAAALASANMLSKASTTIKAALADPGADAFARYLQQSMYANGVMNFRTRAAAASVGAQDRARILSLSPEQVCDVLIPGVCGLRTAVELLDSAAMVMSGVCTAASLVIFAGGTLAEGVGIPLAIATFLEVCVPLEVLDKVATFASLIVSPLNPALRSSADKTALGLSESTTIRTEVTFFGLEDVCKQSAEKALSGALTFAIRRRVITHMLTNNVILDKLIDVWNAIGSDDAYAKVLKKVGESIAFALDRTGLANALAKVASLKCKDVNGGALAVPASRVFTAPPTDSGLLRFNPDSTATYICPSSGPPIFKSSVVLNGSLPLCESKPALTSLTLTCASKPVTITIGDNGSLLDDIFEVIVNGESILTSSTPVRSISATIALSPGDVTVMMRGLAAPDGIGTYFISFAGATLVSGDALSGSDLTPGVVKQFVIRVQP